MSKLFKIFLALLAVVTAVIGIRVGYDTGKKVVYNVAYEDIITKYAKENDLDKYLVMAVVKAESNFVPDAHSGFAGGLMQLTEETAGWVSEKLGVQDYYYMDPETNVKFGCYYLKYLIDICPSIDVALAAYNAGLGNVEAWLKDSRYSDDGKTLKEIPYAETKNYVEKVNTYWQNYRDMYENG